MLNLTETATAGNGIGFYVAVVLLVVGSVLNLIVGVISLSLKYGIKHTLDQLRDLEDEREKQNEWRIWIEGRLAHAGIIPYQPPPS